MALLFQKVRCRQPAFPPAFGPMLPWALFPFKALPSYPVLIRTIPELRRRSGLTLDHVHRSDRILDSANACASARLAEANQSQLPAPRRGPSTTTWMRASELPACRP